MKTKLFVVCLQFWGMVLLAQDNANTLHIAQYLQIVRQYHPVVKLSNIAIDQSKADIQIRRGAFNPIINHYAANKTVDNINYYDYTSPNIVIPTWFGVEVSAGIDNLSGNRFDLSETIGQSSYVGVSIPLLKNLIIDKRRAYLQQSKIYNDMTLTEQQIVINNILQDAVSQYWKWVNAYQNYEIVSKSYTNSKLRFDFIKKTFLNGERPAIDTLEAMTQFQSFEFQKNESLLKFQNEGLELSTFLWNENNTPYHLPAFVIPHQDWGNEVNIQEFSLQLDDLLKNAAQFHPELSIYNQKFEVLTIDKKLKFQELLPKLDFKYNHLAKGYNPFGSEGLLFQNNFQYGLKLEMPLLFSEGRGVYKKAKLKIQETQIAQAQKAQTIDLKVKQYHNEYMVLKNQIKIQSSILDNFRKLLKAEEMLFSNGESSLFLINSRENKVLETENKLVDLKTKYLNTIYKLQWSAGLLK
jgi:outer membrane protein TolC